MASRGRVYVNPNSWVSEDQVVGLNISYMGETKDGVGIHHFTYFDGQRNRRMSYDSLRINGEYYYILGSGHEVDQITGKIIRWESYVNEVTWREALTRNSRDLINRNAR